jgi:hypothetical protein
MEAAILSTLGGIPRFLEAMAPVEALLGDAVFRLWKVQE